MKITKFAHACFVVDTPDRVGIFDPGNFSWASGNFSIDKLSRLDDILITHEHEDHMYLPFIQALVAKFPNVNIVTNPQAAEKLRSSGLDNVSSESSDGIALYAANHESMEPLSPAPTANTGIHYLDSVSSPGDSHHFTETKKVLALPVDGPWGTTARAAALIQELKPEYVLPIHDWLWRDEVRVKMHERLSMFCDTLGIKFLSPVDGEPIGLDL